MMNNVISWINFDAHDDKNDPYDKPGKAMIETKQTKMFIYFLLDAIEHSMKCVV